MSGEVILLRRPEEEEEEKGERVYHVDDRDAWEPEEAQEQDLGPPPAAATASDFHVPPAPLKTAPSVPTTSTRAPASRMRPVQQQWHQQQQDAAVAAASMGPPVDFRYLTQIQGSDTYVPQQYRNYPDLAPAQSQPHLPLQQQHYQHPYGYMGATAPVQSSAAVSEDSETESDIASEASAYRSAQAAQSMDAYDALARARLKGGVVGLREDLSEYDFVCPHCVRMEPVPTGGPIVSFSCCSRRAHYSCMARIPNIHELASQNVPPCIQCLRPSRLPSHQIVLDRYRKAMQSEGRLSTTTGGGGGGAKRPSKGANKKRKGRLGALWNSYDALSAHMRQRGLVAGLGDFVRSEDRTKPPEMNWERAVEQGLDARALLAAGWSLETIAEEFRLYDLDDEEWKTKLGFDRNVLLELPDTDLMYLMSAYSVHPYQLRHRFGVRLPDLWRSADRRRAGGGRGSSSRSRSPGQGQGGPTVDSAAVKARLDSDRRASEGKEARGPARGFETTETICAHHGVLSPRQMAILGFDAHQLIIMGFSKDHFGNFRWFSMDDWITHLGFRKPHWSLLRLTRADFGPQGVFAGLQGWNLDTLMQRWNTSPTELCEMGVVTPDQLKGLLAPASPPAPAAASPPAYHHHQQQQQHPYGHPQAMMMVPMVMTPYGPQPAHYVRHHAAAVPPPAVYAKGYPHYRRMHPGAAARARGRPRGSSTRTQTANRRRRAYPASWRTRGQRGGRGAPSQLRLQRQYGL